MAVTFYNSNSYCGHSKILSLSLPQNDFQDPLAAGQSIFVSMGSSTAVRSTSMQFVLSRVHVAPLLLTVFSNGHSELSHHHTHLACRRRSPTFLINSARADEHFNSSSNHTRSINVSPLGSAQSLRPTELQWVADLLKNRTEVDVFAWRIDRHHWLFFMST